MDNSSPDAAVRAIIRPVLLAAVAGYGLLAALSGADRMSAAHPRIADRVPQWLAGNASAVRSQIALQRGRTTAALTQAEAAVSSAPVEPRSTALLGAARLIAGDAKGAEQAFRVAGQFGWREPLTQLYWYQSALALREYTVASQRLDALLRQNPALLADRRLLDPMERTAQGQQALLDRMAARPGWLLNYARDVSDVADDVMDLRGLVLTRLAARGVALGCDAIAPSVRSLAGAGNAQLAGAVWHAHCPAADKGLIADPRFSAIRIEPPLVPFGWAIAGDGEISVAINSARQAGDQKLTVASSAPVRRGFIAQLLVLKPGDYLLRWKSSDVSGSRLFVSLSCQPDNRDWIAGESSGEPGWHRAALPIDAMCQGHWLTFAIAPGNGSIDLEEVALSRR